MEELGPIKKGLPVGIHRLINNFRINLTKITYGGDSAARLAVAGLIFPVCRVRCLPRKSKYAQYVCAGAPVHLTDLAAVLGCSAAVRGNKETCINPHPLQLAVRNDGELNKLLGHNTILVFPPIFTRFITVIAIV
ncbi:histone H2A [Penicillium soppii]|uniref:histone H2A n=1 Tax=Penicillium soppii TaxID=69789 RepID=UPI002548F021|nr:histone H2A [Penicillium soppii]KAJ5871901.1 histone H2A [Penicillium soppii]